MERKRFVENKYDPKQINENEIKEELKNQIKIIKNILNENYPCDSNKKINSKGKKKMSYSFYTGTGGNLYLYWREYLYTKSKESLKSFQKAYQINYDLAQNYPIEETNSFFFGESGIYLMGCILSKILNDEKLFNLNYNKLINLKEISFNENSELELLYGTAGYLYSLLMLKKECDDLINDKKLFDKTVFDITNKLINEGIKHMELNNWNKCLLFPFPIHNNRQSLYMGAAHGLIGVIYLILCYIKYYPKNNLSKEQMELIKKSVDYIGNSQTEKGNFPSDIKGKKDDILVHFCHGCVGAVHLFNLANQLFNNKNYETILLNIHNSLWKRGLLLKGNGICHGICGNAYSLYKLFSITNNEIYKNEAFCFAKATYDNYVQDKVKLYEDPQRYMIGIPDTPFSLMEGMGGTLCFYYDLLSGNMCFPGYEIF
jgi:hypothetical protein